MTNNTSHHNSVPRAMYHMTTSEAKGWCATFAIEAVVVAIGNLFIIIVFAKTHELRRKSQHFFLINLAVADLLVGTFAEPLFVYVLGGYYKLWSFEYPNIFIFASLFLDMFSGISSIAFLTAIALERLFATTYPVKYRKTRKLWYALVIVALWAVSAVIPIGRLMFGNDYDSLYLWMPFFVHFTAAHWFRVLRYLGKVAVFWFKTFGTLAGKTSERNFDNFNSYVTINMAAIHSFKHGEHVSACQLNGRIRH